MSQAIHWGLWLLFCVGWGYGGPRIFHWWHCRLWNQPYRLPEKILAILFSLATMGILAHFLSP